MWVEQLGGESETWCLPSVGSYLDHGPPSSGSSLLDPLFSWSNLTSSLGEQAEVGGISFSFHSDLQSHLPLPPLVLPGRASCLKQQWASIFLAVWISYLSVVSLCICMRCMAWSCECACVNCRGPRRIAGVSLCCSLPSVLWLGLLLNWKFAFLAVLTLTIKLLGSTCPWLLCLGTQNHSCPASSLTYWAIFSFIVVILINSLPFGQQGKFREATEIYSSV